MLTQPSVSQFFYLQSKTRPKKNKVLTLNSHLHLDGRMRVVVMDFKILCLEIVNLNHLPSDLQFREGADLPLKLQRETDGASVMGKVG